MLSYNEAQVQPTARPGWNVVLTAGKTMEREKIFLPTFMSSRGWGLKGGIRFCVCWLLPLTCAHLISELTFLSRRASPWRQQSGRGSVIARSSSGSGEVQATTVGNQEQTVVVPGLHASFGSLPVRPGMLCFACRATWHGARDMNLRDGIAAWTAVFPPPFDTNACTDHRLWDSITRLQGGGWEHSSYGLAQGQCL